MKLPALGSFISKLERKNWFFLEEKQCNNDRETGVVYTGKYRVKVYALRLPLKVYEYITRSHDPLITCT